MAAREFAVHKVRNQYVTVPVDHYPNATRTAYGLWGVVLAALGLRHRGWTRLAVVTAGGMMVFRAATGRGILPARWFSWLCPAPCGGPRASRPDLAPSYQNDFRSRAGQMPEDQVDEASMESFPASDAPARMSRVEPK